MIEREVKKLELQNGLVPFDEWFDSLRNKKMQVAVDARLARVRAGNFGDCKPVAAECLNCGSRLARDSASITDFTAGKWSSCWVAVIKAASRATSAARNSCGNNLQSMRLKNYKDDLNRRLRDPEYAAEYLAQVLAEKDNAAFLIALKDVVEAGGGMGNLAGRVGLKRPSLYKILSRNGNPTLETLQEILKPLGLRVSVALNETA
jgi:probable addiction module antidote protein